VKTENSEIPLHTDNIHSVQTASYSKCLCHRSGYDLDTPHRSHAWLQVDSLRLTASEAGTSW